MTWIPWYWFQQHWPWLIAMLIWFLHQIPGH